MLTPSDVKNYEFSRASRSTYKSEEVDQFLIDVYNSYAQLYKENGELIKKLQLLAERVENYRQDEDSIRSALLTAQRMADTIVKEATQKVETLTETSKEEAKKILEEAQQEADTISKESKEQSDKLLKTVSDRATQILENAKKEATTTTQNAKSQVLHEQKTLERMKREVSAFKSKMLNMYKEQVDCINRLPSVFVEEEEKLPEDRQKKISDVKVEQKPEDEVVKEEVLSNTQTQTQEVVESEVSQQTIQTENESNEISSDEVKQNLQNTMEISKEKFGTLPYTPQTQQELMDKHFSHDKIGKFANAEIETPLDSENIDFSKFTFSSMNEDDNFSNEEDTKKKGFFRRK